MADARGIPRQGRYARVLVIDTHRLFAELLSAVLHTQSDLECVGRAFSEAEGRQAFLATAPDIVVIDTGLIADGGVSLAADLLGRRPEIRIVMVADVARAEILRAAARVGVCAYLPKASPLEDILDAIRSSRVGTLIAPAHLVVAATEEVSMVDVDDADLTPRQREVLHLLSEGLAVQQISRRLGLSIHTTRGYVKTLLARLDAHSQLEAVAIAKRRGLLRSAS
jgi:DNA-binding NarL/FixJ family response regulator